MTCLLYYIEISDEVVSLNVFACFYCNRNISCHFKIPTATSISLFFFFFFFTTNRNTFEKGTQIESAKHIILLA